MAVVTASARGQIVIPKDVRRRLNIIGGSKLLLKVVGERVILEPLPEDPVAAFCGVFREGDSLTGALREERRNEADREQSKIAG